MNSSYSSYGPGASHPIPHIVLVQIILFIKSSILNQFYTPSSSDDLCLLFCLYPSSTPSMVCTSFIKIYWNCILSLKYWYVFNGRLQDGKFTSYYYSLSYFSTSVCEWVTSKWWMGLVRTVHTHNKPNPPISLTNPWSIGQKGWWREWECEGERNWSESRCKRDNQIITRLP